MGETVYVVAEYYQQFHYWCRHIAVPPRDPTDPSIVYVHDGRVLQGRRIESGDRVVITGTARQRADYDELLTALRVAGWDGRG